MSTIAKSLVTVVVTTTLVALLGYFFGFAMLFTHTMAEIFWYGLLFGGSNILTLSAVWFFSRNKVAVEPKDVTPVAPATASQPAKPATV